MDPFRTLRETAAAKRDTAIAEARRIYRADIAAIEKLERSLPAETPKKPVIKDGPNTTEWIVKLIPRDKPFTIPDLLHLLHDATGKTHSEPTIRTYVSRLCNRGVIRKLYKVGQQYALWVAADVEVEEGSIDTLSLREMVEQVLVEEGPRTVVEIVVGMQSRGYRVDSTPQSLASAVREMFKRYKGRFVRGKGSRWARALVEEEGAA